MERSILLFGSEEILTEVELTIAIPSYRRTDTLREAIDSVLNQVATDISFALLISEDHSDCHSEIEQIVKSYHDNRIIYYYNRVAMGMTGNWNNCINLAKSKYVALLHDDDILYSNYLEVVKCIFDLKLDFDVLYFDHDIVKNNVIIEEQTNTLKKIYIRMQKDKLRRYYSGDYYWGACQNKLVPSCGNLYNTKVIKDFGGYKKEDGFSADEIFAERLSRKHKVYFCMHTVSAYRYMDANITNQKGTKRGFVLEGKNHRLDMGREIALYKCMNILFADCFIYALSGPWYNSLFAERAISKREIKLAALYRGCARLYIYGRALWVAIIGKRIVFYD